MYLLTVLGLGAAAFAVDRSLLQPSPAGAATSASRPAGSVGAPAGPGRAPEPSVEAAGARGEPLPAPSVPALASRLESLGAPEVTPDIFRADPAEWGLPAPGATSERPAEVELRLSAIMNADGAGASGSCAVINSRIVRVGQSVAGFTVEAITPAAVKLRRGEQTRELRLAR